MLTGVIVIVVAAILVGVYVSWRAGRLDRLHARVEAARAALDAALVRRSSIALELAASGLLDPATSLLIAGAAHDARAAGEPNERAESDLTRALRAALGQPGFRADLAARSARGRGARRTRSRRPPGVPGPEVLQRRGRRHPRLAAPVAGPATPPVRRCPLA